MRQSNEDVTFTVLANTSLFDEQKTVTIPRTQLTEPSNAYVDNYVRIQFKNDALSIEKIEP